jgi:hypothetical protein
MEDHEYEDVIRSMVLVDEAAEDQLVVKFDGRTFGTYDHIDLACDAARELAASNGVKWDVTIQARNSWDMA